MTARQIIQTAVGERGIIQCDPNRDGIRRGERPERVIEVPCRGIAIGWLEERLIVPDTYAGDPGERSRNFAEAAIKHELMHTGVSNGQPLTLCEHSGIIIVISKVLI